ncbi:MAG: hypothetical protein K2X03_16220 [Bryobacteraceae bacterium]|nr:hypothetical protein [Bryobacteraceae bacterium]
MKKIVSLGLLLIAILTAVGGLIQTWAGLNSLGFFYYGLAFFLAVAVAFLARKTHSKALPPGASFWRELLEKVTKQDIIDVANSMGTLIKSWNQPNSPAPPMGTEDSTTPLPQSKLIKGELRQELRKHRFSQNQQDQVIRLSTDLISSRDIAELGAQLEGRADPRSVMQLVEVARFIRPKITKQLPRGDSFYREIAALVADWRKDKSIAMESIIERRLLEYFSFDERLVWYLTDLRIEINLISQLTGISADLVSAYLKTSREAFREISKRADRQSQATTVQSELPLMYSSACKQWAISLH